MIYWESFKHTIKAGDSFRLGDSVIVIDAIDDTALFGLVDFVNFTIDGIQQRMTFRGFCEQIVQDGWTLIEKVGGIV